MRFETDPPVPAADAVVVVLELLVLVDDKPKFSGVAKLVEPVVLGVEVVAPPNMKPPVKLELVVVAVLRENPVDADVVAPESENPVAALVVAPGREKPVPALVVAGRENPLNVGADVLGKDVAVNPEGALVLAVVLGAVPRPKAVLPPEVPPKLKPVVVLEEAGRLKPVVPPVPRVPPPNVRLGAVEVAGFI